METVVQFQDMTIQGCGIYGAYYVTAFSLAYKNSSSPGWTVLRDSAGTTAQVCEILYCIIVLSRCY